MAAQESHVTKFEQNVGGLNLTDTPQLIQPTQATGLSYNYEYATVGGIYKVLSALALNTLADGQLKTLGLCVLHDALTDARSVIRAAGIKLQVFNPSTLGFTTLAEDTAVAGTSFLAAGNTMPVANAPFNALLGGTRVWLAGGGMGPLYGTNALFATKNGADQPLGKFGVSLTSSSSGGVWVGTGLYFYALGLRKKQTLSQSNASLDISITVDDATKGVVLDLSTLNIDATKYDQIIVYRSAVAGVAQFTTGNIVAQLPSNTTTYTDLGSSQASAQVVPRPGGTTDNSPLPVFANANLTLGGVTYTATPNLGTLGNSISIAYTPGGSAGSEVVTVTNFAISVQIQSGVSTPAQIVKAINANYAALALVSVNSTSSTAVNTTGATALTGGLNGAYNTVTAFKRRLATAQGGTVYLSDTNKDEAWPLANTFTPPSGGPIVAVATVGVNSEFTTGADQYLLIFKERELWCITGNSIADWQMQFVAQVGTVNQNCVIPMTGYAVWLAFNGIYAWDGAGKPVRISRPINALWDTDGDLDKGQIKSTWGAYFEKANVVVWRTSSRIRGAQKLSIKLDVRLTVPQISQNVGNLEADGVFNLDYDGNAYYAGCSYRSTGYFEQLLSGDDTGFIYNMYTGAGAVAFDYETNALDCGYPERNKRFKRVFVWVERLLDVDLTLFYWANYQRRDIYKSQENVPVGAVSSTAPALWDVAYFDQSLFDDYVPDVAVIVYNLHAEDNNIEGVALKLRFEQLDANAPIRIHMFAVEWDDLGIVSPVPSPSEG